jgi:hypothetical protein
LSFGSVVTSKLDYEKRKKKKTRKKFISAVVGIELWFRSYKKLDYEKRKK